MTVKAWVKGGIQGHARGRRAGSTMIAKFCSVYLDAYFNRGYDRRANGEVWLLRRLGELDIRTVFDVGANMGEWTADALALVPNAEIHSFEIASSLGQRLHERFRAEPRVVVNESGLGDRSGDVAIDFYLAGSHTGTTMMTDERIHLHHAAERQQARVERGDKYCWARNNLSVDFVKIDVEGAELEVMRGFGSMLAEGRIGALQFEYNAIDIGTRVLLRDYYEYLEQFGYSIGKLWPDHVSFGPYDWREEDFRGPNYVAVHDSRPDIRRALSRRG